MKYLKPDLNEKEWAEALKLYWHNFDLTKPLLPSQFCKEYQKTGFHDFSLVSVKWYKDYESQKDQYCVDILLQFDSDFYLLQYLRVSKFKMNFIPEAGFNNSYRYGEVTAGENAKIVHEIDFGEERDILIEFKKLKFHKFNME